MDRYTAPELDRTIYRSRAGWLDNTAQELDGSIYRSRAGWIDIPLKSWMYRYTAQELDGSIYRSRAGWIDMPLKSWMDRYTAQDFHLYCYAAPPAITFLFSMSLSSDNFRL